MYKLLFAALLLTVVMVNGCAEGNEKAENEEHYAEDGYMGLTSSNPSLVGTPNSNNHARDIEMIKRALKEVPHIRKSRIILDGGFAYIHIHVNPELSEHEAAQVKAQTEQKLSEMIPQYYRIRVTVDQ